MEKRVLTIDGLDYFWQDAVLYTKSTTKSAWDKLKTFDNDIVNVEPTNGEKLIVNTTKERLLVDVNGIIRMVMSKHEIVDMPK